jgi:N-acetylgalactosamine-N,N'-diacetylbacillosaminyl-diphospho-undecaprenol 4-alpha-N-acetylgalactosaminyltransferase
MYHCNIVSCIAKLIKPELKVSIRESTSFNFYKNYFSSFSVKILVILCRLFYPRADEIIFPSKAMKDIFFKEVGLGSFKRYRILPNLVDADELSTKAKEVIAPEVWQKTRKKVLINVGRIDKNKNQILIVQAVKKLEELDFEYIQLGDGPELSNLKEQVAKLGLSDRIKFLGYQENPFKFLKAADIFVLSSLVEGYPNVLAQAKFFNLDIVALDCPTGPAEILADYPNGFLVSLNSTDLVDAIAIKIRDLL